MKKTLYLALGLIAVAVFLDRIVTCQRPPEPASATALPGIPPPADPSSSQPTKEVSPAPAPTLKPRRIEKTVFQRIAANETNVFQVTPELAQAFLARNKTNAESLLTVFSLTHDKEFLKEAARRYPSNAFVLASVLGYDALPEQRRELLDQFKAVSPGNPLANYLSARDYVKNQQPELALQEFVDASAKGPLQDFSVERLQGLEEFYLSSGTSAAEAKALAMANLEMPALSKLRDIGRDMSALQRQYAGAGDEASAQTMTKLGLSLADNATSAGANSLLSQMVGIGVEREFLGGLDRNASYDFLAQPVGERLARLQAQEDAVRSEAKFFDVWLANANEGQLVSYFDRLKLYGEGAALSWAKGQFGADSQP